MITGSVLGLTVYSWQKIVREDGSRVTLEHQKSLKEELISSYRVVMANQWIVFFFPMSWAVNFYFIYQGNQYNGAVFTGESYFLARAFPINSFHILGGVPQA